MMTKKKHRRKRCRGINVMGSRLTAHNASLRIYVLRKIFL